MYFITLNLLVGMSTTRHVFPLTLVGLNQLPYVRPQWFPQGMLEY